MVRMWVEDIAAAVSLTLFVATMLLWAAILGGNFPVDWLP